MKHNIVAEQGVPTSATVFHDGRVYVAAPGHPNFAKIIEALTTGARPRKVIGLFDVAGFITRSLKAAARRLGATDVDSAAESLTIENGRVLWDGQPVSGPLADTILAYSRTDSDDFLPLARFMVKVMTNPNEHSREMLFDWMRSLSFNIAEDGDMLALKAVQPDQHGDLRSINSGSALVNGVAEHGRIRNNVGDVVTMPRSEVNHDPFEGCSTGLHVGTQGYARDFGRNFGTIIEVKVNPADVVSVPTDCDSAKMRVCRYEVYRVVEEAKTPELATIGAATATVDEARWAALLASDPPFSDDEYGDEDDYQTCGDCGDETDGEEYCTACLWADDYDADDYDDNGPDTYRYEP